MSRWTEGVPRLRLEWSEGGHRRGLTWELARAVREQTDRIINDSNKVDSARAT